MQKVGGAGGSWGSALPDGRFSPNQGASALLLSLGRRDCFLRPAFESWAQTQKHEGRRGRAGCVRGPEVGKGESQLRAPSPQPDAICSR